MLGARTRARYTFVAMHSRRSLALAVLLACNGCWITRVVSLIAVAFFLFSSLNIALAVVILRSLCGRRKTKSKLVWPVLSTRCAVHTNVCSFYVFCALFGAAYMRM